MFERSYVRELFDDPLLVGFQIEDMLYSPKDINILFAAPAGANPETCRHRVLIAGFSPTGLIPFIKCMSCDTDVTDKSNHIGKTYQYDFEHRVWVQVGPTRR